MFKAGNPYEEVVNKATAETLTSEDWQTNLDICDKVSGEGETGARHCVGAIQKRLVHRNANVQLYSLTLADAIAKNCGIDAHRELASRAFTQTLSRVVADRNTHEKVRDKTLSLLREWERDFTESDETSSMVQETIDALKAQGHYKGEDIRGGGGGAPSPPPNEPSSEQLRREDEELRRVLELSLQDQGGRGAYDNYGGGAGGSAGAGASASTGASASASATARNSAADKVLPAAGSAVPAHRDQQATQPVQSQTPAPATPAAATAPSRVRALYDFAPTEIGELAFSKNDIIRVLDSVYEHWWRGELRGEAGIFPVNYVEILPDPTPAEIQREAEQEARIFAQAHDIDKLLAKLRYLDPHTANLAEDEELQDLYNSSLAMRPKIVKLIDRYSSKVQELRAMNDKFVRARSQFDGMMVAASAGAPGNASGQQEQGCYGQPQQYAQPQQQHGQYPQQHTPQHQQYQQQQQYQPQQQPSPIAHYQQPSNASHQYGQPSTPGHASAPTHYQQSSQPQADGQLQQYGHGQYQQHPSQPGASQAPQEDEKRRLYEQARREAEAYHAQYGQQPESAGPAAGGSAAGGGPSGPSAPHQYAGYQPQ